MDRITDDSRFGVLGPLLVMIAGHDVTPRAAHERSLLALMLMSPGRVFSVGEIVSALWGDTPTQRAEKTIQVYISRLRRSLGNPQLIITQAPGYLLAVPLPAVDAARFEAAGTSGRSALRRGEAGQATALLRDALALWRGEPLADISAPFAEAERARLGEMRLAAIADRIDADLALGLGSELVPELEVLTARYPLRERFWGQLMTALYRSGRQGDALAVYRRLRRVLVEDLGVEPGPEVRAIEAMVLAQDPRLAVVPPASAGNSASLRTGGHRSSVKDVSPSEKVHRLAQLPPDTVSFIGRTGELAQLLTAAFDARISRERRAPVVCAIDGMAGIGKTALAVHAAHQIVERFEDGCLFLDLHGYAHEMSEVHPQQALPRLLRALGIPGEQIPGEVDDQAALYRSRLTGKRMLILLDNARTAEQVRLLVPAEPGCMVIVTSRRRLVSLETAKSLSLGVLPDSDAVALLAKASGRGVDPAAQRIITLCGHLPLAIRIAAARLRTRPAWPMSHLADRLARQGDTLDALGDERGGPAAAFTLSYRDLTSDQQRTFRFLSLHPGADIDVSAAAALIDTDESPTARLLDDLVDAHLLLQDVAGRFRFHDLVRSYAAQLASRCELADVRHAAHTRLFDYYLCALLKAQGSARIPGSTSGAAWLDVERQNLQATVAYTAQHGWPAYAIRLAAALYRYLDIAGYLAEAQTIHLHAYEAARQLNDVAGQAHALTNLGNVYWRQGNDELAADHLRRAASIFRDTGVRHGQARVMTSLGLVHWRQGRYKDAAEQLEHALALYRDTGHHSGQAHALHNLGLVYGRQGNYEEAASCFEQALGISREKGQKLDQAYTLNFLAIVRLKQGVLSQAIDLASEAMSLFQETGHRYGQAHVLANQGLILDQQGRHQEALDHHRRALTLFRGITDRGGEAYALNGLGESLQATGHVEQARANHEAAHSLALQTGDRYEQARAHVGLARAYDKTNQHDQAGDHWQHAYDLYAGLGVPEAKEVRAHVAE